MRIIFPILFLMCTGMLTAQVNGGLHAFESFGLPQTARITALGGALISVMDGDVALASQNPALINREMNNQLSINHNFIFAGISSSYLGFGKRLEKLGLNTHIALQSNGYGSFKLTDEIGNQLGEFKANELGLIMGTSKQLNQRIRVGVNLKVGLGSYESYNSSAIGADIGILYGQQSDTTAQIAIVFKNIGTTLSSIGEDASNLPFDIQIGYAKRLAHLPFRFSIIAHNLQRWNVRYDDPDNIVQTNFIGEEITQSNFNNQLDNFFRHFIFSGAFLFGKAETFRLRFGYNHLRKQELKVASFRSLSGFSLGVGFNVKKIKFDYGVGYHHLAGANNQLSLRIGLDRFFNKI